MASPNTPTVVYGPNVAQVRPMIQKPPVALPVTSLPGITLVQTASTSARGSKLCGKSMLSLGVTPGRYRYNTATMNGKAGVVMFPICSQGEEEKTKFFVPFTKNNTTSTVTSPTVVKLQDFKSFQKPAPVQCLGLQNTGVFSKNTTASEETSPTSVKPSDFQKPDPITSFSPQNPGTIVLRADSKLKNVYRTNTVIPARYPTVRMDGVNHQLVGPLRPQFMKTSPTASSMGLQYSNVQQRFPVVKVLKPSADGQNSPVVTFVLDKGSAPTQTSLSSVMGKLPNHNTNTSSAMSVVKSEPPDYNQPVGTLLIKQSPDKSSVSAVTFPSPSHPFTSTSQTSPNTLLNTFHTFPNTSHSSLTTSKKSTKTSHKSTKTSNTITTSNNSRSTPCTTHTSWSALKPVSVPEESPSLPALNNTDTKLAENVETLTEVDTGMSFKIDSVFSLRGSNLTAEEDFIQTEQQGELGGTTTGQEINKDQTEEKQEVKENEHRQKTRCKYNKVCFSVIEKLKLQGLPTVDVRKLRKLTGRQSCSKKCREKTVERYCRLNKLCINEKPLILDFPLLTDIKMEPEELQQFEAFLKICQPAPRFRKLLLFHQNKYTSNVKISNVKAGTKSGCYKTKSKLKVERLSPGVNSEDEFVVLNKKKKRQKILRQKDIGDGKCPAHVKNSTEEQVQKLSNKAKSLLNPDGNQNSGSISQDPNKDVTQRTITTKQVLASDGAAMSRVIKPLLDTKSPAFQKAVSALGTKKFFLLRVEGKNILMPVEQNSVLPRAYVLGDNTVGVSSQMYSSVTIAEPRSVPVANSSTNTKDTVKAERPDSGYESPVSINNKLSQSQTIPVRVKQEPTGRGYADEMSPALTSTSQEKGNRVSVMNTPSGTKNTEETSNPTAIDTDEFNKPSTSQPSTLKSILHPTSSADRIRKLKELLKKNEEELEMIKKRRLEEAVDVSGILEDTGM